ncbi:unnamed protein product, partial [Mesorhabditis belari]|uniref:BZIP domain-containing protein n=1 Tax=Mesorhabditis belari TaxID=2138241 RepID=A0AAF3EIN4_9BILA
MLLYFSKEFEDDLLKFDETLHPSCAFMNKQYQGRKELECTTLRSMGLGSGKVLIRFNRIPMSAMEVAQTEERIEQERRKKEALAAEFQKKRAENEEREKIERERMQKFEEEQRFLEEEKRTMLRKEQKMLPANPNSWSFDRHPFQAAISSGPANDRLTYLNSLLNNVDASLAGQTSNDQVNNLVEQLASEGRLHDQQNMSEQYPLMNFKFPEKTTAIEDADMDDQSTSMTAQTGQDIEAPDRQSVLFTKKEYNKAVPEKPEESMEIDEKFFEVNLEDVRNMQRALSDQVKQEQQRALLPKAYIETKNRELKLTSWKNTVIRAVPEKTLIDVGVAPSSTIYVKFSPPMAACEDIFKVDSVKEVMEEEANQSSKEWLSTNEAYKPWVGTVGPEAPRPMSCSSSSLGSLLIPKELNNNSNQEKSGSETPSSAFSSLSNPSSSNEGSEASASPNRVIVRSSAPKKRKEVVKDESYWEKRKKNNDAAKRSRDQRRIKEDKVASRATSLERENAMLRIELERLRAETRILNRILHNPAQEEKGAFKMKCVIESNGSWRTEVIGCLTPDGVDVPVNGRKAVGDHEWACEQTADGHISLKQEMGKNADCPGGRKRGSTWIDKSFEFLCEEGGMPKFVGCITNTGIRIANGETKELAGGILVECKQYPNGTITLNGIGKKANADCTDSEGGKHKFGEKWIQRKHFQFTCKSHGETQMIGCVIPEGQVIPLNSKLTVGLMEYHCEVNGGSLKFYGKPKDQN